MVLLLLLTPVSCCTDLGGTRDAQATSVQHVKDPNELPGLSCGLSGIVSQHLGSELADGSSVSLLLSLK